MVQLEVVENKMMQEVMDLSWNREKQGKRQYEGGGAGSGGGEGNGEKKMKKRDVALSRGYVVSWRPVG
jgi:hypothetical protein